MIDWKKYAILARQTAAEGAVLLKNDKETLPLKKGTVVSVFGRIQLSYYKSGTGSGGLVNTPYTVGILDALKEEKDICLNTELLDIYEKWVSAHPFDLGDGWAKEPWCQEEMPLSTEQVQRAAEISNIAIVILGRTAGEDQDTQNQKGSYLLTDLEEDMLKGYDLGADDYVTKPFSIKILLKKISVILSREPKNFHIYDDGFLRIDFELGKVQKGKEECPVTPTEYRILKKLIQNKGQLLTYSLLLDSLWDEGVQLLDKHALAVNINRLRKKIETEEHSYISNVYGMGYIWK